MIDRYKINAVLDEELENLLKSKGLLEDLENGKITCSICGETLTIRNIGAIHVLGGNVKLCCDAEECINQNIPKP